MDWHCLVLPPCILWTESGDRPVFNCRRSYAHARPAYCLFSCMVHKPGRSVPRSSTEARGLPYALPAYGPWNMLVRFCQKYGGHHLHHQSLQCPGHHHQRQKSPPGHTPAHRALSQVAAVRTGSCLNSGWCWRPGHPPYSWIQQIGDGTPFGVHAEWSKSWAFQVDATDLFYLCDPMTMNVNRVGKFCGLVTDC